MQTEKQVEKMLEAIDEKTVDILNRKRKEHTKMYNEDEAKKALRAIEIDPDIESYSGRPVTCYRWTASL